MAANFSNSTPAAPAGYVNGTWQFDLSGNVSVYVPTSILTDQNTSLVSLLPGDVLVWNGSEWVNSSIPGPFLPLAGNGPTDPMTGEIFGNSNFTSSVLGNITGGFSILDASGNQFLSGYSSGTGTPLVGYLAPIPTGVFFFISGNQDVLELGNGGVGFPNFQLVNYTGTAGVINNYGSSSLVLFGQPVKIDGGNTSANQVIISGTSIDILSGIPLQWNADSGISRLDADSLAIGNGTQGNTSGSLSLTNILSQPVTPPTSAATAGTKGQIVTGTDGNLYVCTNTGTATHATWKVATLTSV